MSRLPTPGGDDGNWGNVLNDFLNVSHDIDGSIRAGAVSQADVGLGNVDNTSDADKPISSATQTALDAKADTGLAGLPAGSTFTIYWDGGSSSWKYNGSTITSRPSSRTDLTMLAIGGLTGPVFGVVNVDVWLKDLS